MGPGTVNNVVMGSYGLHSGLIGINAGKDRAKGWNGITVGLCGGLWEELIKVSG